MHTTDLKLLLPAVPGKDNLSHAATSGYYFSGLRHGSIVLGYLVVRFSHTAPCVEYSAISLSLQMQITLDVRSCGESNAHSS